MAGEQNLQRRLALIQSKKKKSQRRKEWIGRRERMGQWGREEEKRWGEAGGRAGGRAAAAGGRGVTKKPRNHVTLVYESR